MLRAKKEPITIKESSRICREYYPGLVFSGQCLPIVENSTRLYCKCDVPKKTDSNLKVD